MRSGWRFISIIVGVFAALAASSLREAWPHASLVSSDPLDGAVLAVQPDSVTLLFNEAVAPTMARLLTPEQRGFDLAEISAQGNAVILRMPAQLPNGTQVLSWRVVSEDGHPVGGALVFSIGYATSTAATSVETPLGVRAALWLARFLLMTGASFGVGGVAFSMFLVKDRVLPRAAGRVIDGSLLGGAIGACALVGLQGLDLGGRPFAALARADVWEAGLFATGFGFTAAVLCIAFLLALGARRLTDGAVARSLAATALLLVGAAFAASGHAAAAQPQWLTRPAVAIHVIAVAFWIGALAPLAALLRADRPDSRGALKRFSDWIPFALTALFGSGLALAIIQLGSVGALWRTDYGLILCVKLALLAVLLFLALVNRLFLTRPVLAGSPQERSRLVHSISTETATAFAILGVAGLWRFTAPPRASAQASGDAEQVNISGEELTARLTFRPPRAGLVMIAIDQIRMNGAALSPVAISLIVEKPSFGLGPFQKAMVRDAAGGFAPARFFLPMDGFWIVRAECLVSEFRKVVLTDIISLQRSPSA